MKERRRKERPRKKRRRKKRRRNQPQSTGAPGGSPHLI
jgi:hypothetical protein